MNIDECVEKLMQKIEAATAPEMMPQTDALEILEELAGRLEGSIEGQRDDLKNQDKE